MPGLLTVWKRWEAADVKRRGQNGHFVAKKLYLKGSKECIAERLAGRAEHFMPSALLESWFVILEEPRGALIVDIAQPKAFIIKQLKN